MIETDKRRAVFLLHQEGQPVRQIARLLGLSVNTARVIIEQEGVAPPPRPRADKQTLDEELLRRLYQECQGWVVRVHEKLVEEQGVTVTYSTVKRRLRELGISDPPKTRCQHVPDEPGVEMQHDTSPYPIALAGRRVGLIASLIYLRYSKRRYLKFYRAFDRFKMKGFFHQALTFWGHAARQCIIDNTNLARLRGTGANAVIHPEMEAFARQYGFVFRCHALKHANRKAGEERSFWTVETNFLPGRTFQSLEDLNRQALEWSTVRWEHRPQGKARLIPAKAFEHERTYLIELPAHLPAPRHQPHHRKQPAQEEEKHLRALSPAVSAYVDFILKTPGIYRHELLRRLLALSRKMTPQLFIKSVERAHQYQISSLPTLERIALLYLDEGSGTLPWVEINETFRQREAYQEGSLTEPPDLSVYQTPPDHE